MVMLLLVTGGLQAVGLVNIQLTTSPLASVLLVKVPLFVPALSPFKSHLYSGVLPPLVPVAVKVTGVPEQILFPEAVILTDKGNTGATVNVMLLLTAFAGTAQVELLVMVQLTTSPLLNELSVNVALFVPTLLPFSCHW